jgi:hypothetical protein
VRDVIWRDDGGGYSIYATGNTAGALPGISGASADPVAQSQEGFIARLTPGLAILGASYVGGSHAEYMDSLVVPAGSTGTVYAIGSSFSTSMPGIDGASADGFGSGGEWILFKFSPDLTQILGATFLGGFGLEWGQGVTLDPTQGDASDVFVAGSSGAPNFPGVTVNSADMTWSGGHEGAIARVVPSLQKRFMLNAALIKILLQLLQQNGARDLDDLSAAIDAVESAGRRWAWTDAIEAAESFDTLVDRHADAGDITADDARQLRALGAELVDGLREASAEQPPSGDEPRETPPPEGTLGSCPASPALPRDPSRD